MMKIISALAVLALYTSLVAMPAIASDYTLDIFGNANKGSFYSRAAYQEYLTRFQRLNIGLDEHGVFVYPEAE